MVLQTIINHVVYKGQASQPRKQEIKHHLPKANNTKSVSYIEFSV